MTFIIAITVLAAVLLAVAFVRDDEDLMGVGITVAIIALALLATTVAVFTIEG